ncbi:ABC transporter permease subunit [Stratiformator vulcanicus]|uniref:ABC-2 family transporter protein n=1 Tax=Stratiformator vulcanicus TaxID=2527980 RepID=A0A517R0A9_9PLAN|nr:ABC transporter permease subunit [Stratiformator vulcanicus]QDT37336.1 ABC-2 family transporter protein [Stratiformator vulcanicus]
MSGLLALFTRSLKVDANGWKGHTFRLAFAAMIAFALLRMIARIATVGAPGLDFFTGIAYLNVFFISLAGVSFFATAITEEKEEGTLGLLRMAGIGSSAILLGKSTSRLVGAGLLLVVQFPFFLLSITLGGVLMPQIWAAAASLLAFLAFVGNVGLFFSVLCKRSGTAVALSAVVLAGYFGLPIVIEPLIGNPLILLGIPISPIAEAVSDFSVITRLNEILLTNFAEQPFGTQVVSNLVVAVVLFLTAWMLFSREGHEDETAEPGRVAQGPGRFKAFSPGRAWGDPFAWKEFYFLSGGIPLILLKVIAYVALAVVIYAYVYYSSRRFDIEEVGAILVGAALIAAVVETCRVAVSLFKEEVYGHNLEALVLLPNPIAKIAVGKVMGVLPTLTPVLIFLILAMFSTPRVTEGSQELLSSSYLYAGVAYYIVFLHVVVLMSLFVRWGAVPLAFLVTIFATYAVSPLALFSVLFAGIIDSAQAGALPLVVMLAAAAFALQLAIQRRLIVLGGR